MRAAFVFLTLYPAFASDPSRCLSCHKTETESYLASPMGRSLGTHAELPPGRVAGPAGTVTIRPTGGKLVQTLKAKGLEATYPVSYSVGSGIVGFSFLVSVGDALFQSPVSYYSKAAKWDLTPGYEHDSALDFTHRVTEGCVFCHAGKANLKPGTTDRFSAPELEPISCERCHGAAEAHLKNPVLGSIVNPSKLSPAQRDSVCEQCHLEGAARVLNPGKHWFDFQAGGLTERVFATYLRGPTEDGELRAVSQSELLAQSRCFRQSGGRLWCGSCHSPHELAGRQQVSVQKACLGCHPTIPSNTSHPSLGDCASCHMPRLRPTDVPHSSATDHRITTPNAKRRMKPVCAGAGCFAAWREPEAALQQRNRALGLFQFAADRVRKEELALAYNLLTQIYAKGSHDPEAISTLASILLQQNHPDLSSKLYRQAAELAPENARFQFCLGESLRSEGKTALAIAALQRSIALDATAPEAYLALEKIYAAAGQHANRKQVLLDYLWLMPENIEFRERLRR